MSDWRPSSSAEVARRRAEMLALARRYFTDNKVLEVDTPSLSPSAATDRHIDSLSIRDSELYLHTSPEFHMKRLLAAGFPDIYSICRVFRGSEKGRTHLQEFTMIEWYRRSMKLSAIVADTLQFIATVLQRPELAGNARKWDYVDVFQETANLDPLTAPIDELANAMATDQPLRASLGDDRDAWLDLIMATQVAAGFRSSELTVVQHYPASQAALARFCPDNTKVADRFEIYYGALELANGYVELSDVAEQIRRIDCDRHYRRESGLPDIPRDEQLIAALRSGLPDCAGVALGFERLHMIDAGTDDIRNVVSFA